jgi:hypothetical protein
MGVADIANRSCAERLAVHDGRTVTRADTLPIRMAPGGGWIARLTRQ